MDIQVLASGNSGNCIRISDGITPLLLDADTVEPVVRHRVIQSHMSLDTLKGLLLANDLSHLQEIHLLHLSSSNSDAERFKREVQELTGKVVYVH